MLVLLAWSLLAPPALAQDEEEPIPAGVVEDESPAWQSTLERVVPAVVSIRVTGTRDFDTEDARSSVGTGFVVDAERGLILTNRHMVHAGPVVAEAVFLDHEEVELQPIYRDPVHDFGFYRFDPAALRFMELRELTLAPEAARVGMDIRVVGNDAGEKISILDGTLARLDRAAPSYGGDTYNDFNTFYYQAASGTSGGSSGSPVVGIDGRVVALNAGGRRQAASSYYLPLDRVVRALALIQQGEEVPRGTIQTIFRHEPFDEVRRLGLAETTEQEVRSERPDATGMLVVTQVVPEGPAWEQLEPGDVLVRVNGALVNQFVPLEAALDDSVGETVTVEVERGGRALRLELPVRDLHAITPDRYLEVGRSILHPLSYQQARNHALPVEGIYVAVSGYMLGRAGIPEGALIRAIDGAPVPDLPALERILETKADGERMVWRFSVVSEPRRDHVAVVSMDRLWFEMRTCVRDDGAGVWHCTGADDPPPPAPRPEAATTALTSTDRVGRKLADAFVMVEFDIPYPTAGVKDFNFVGSGVVVDAVRGRVLVDRDTVPVALGDIEIIFAGTLRVPGRLRYLHPVHNLAVLEYDPELLGETPVSAVSFSTEALEPGDRIWQVGLDRAYRVVSNRTEVERVEPLDLRASSTPRYRDLNVEGVEIANPTPSLGGVLADRRGRAHALWASFVEPASGERRFYGLPARYLPEWLLAGGEPAPTCALGAELDPIPLADAQARGLSVARTQLLVAEDPIRRSVLEVARVMGGSGAREGGLRTGDLLLEVFAGGTVHVPTGMADVEDLTDVLCDGEAEVTVLRDGEEATLTFAGTLLEGHGVDRAVTWAGLVVHEPHVEVKTQEGIDPEGVYVAWLWYGSPGSRYGLRPTRRIIAVDDHPTPDLDAFLEAVRGHRHRQAVRVKMVALDGQVSVETLKLDTRDWPLQVFLRDEDGSWTRR